MKEIYYELIAGFFFSICIGLFFLIRFLRFRKNKIESIFPKRKFWKIILWIIIALNILMYPIFILDLAVPNWSKWLNEK